MEKGGEKARWCQSDGVLVDTEAKRLTIIECKFSHVDRSYWQLERLYLPVIRKVFGDEWDYRLVEVCKWYDPDIPYPEHQRITSVKMAPRHPIIGVHIWKPLSSGVKPALDLLSRRR